MKRENDLTGRQTSIDILKIICAILVVCNHAPFPGVMGECIIVLTRITVPIFFIISGYFYADVKNRGSEKGQIKKIFKLTIGANILYLLWNIFLAIASRDIGILENEFTIKKILKFVCLNESPFAGHLWYLSAFLYVLVIVLLMDKINCRKLLYILTPFLLLGDLVLGKYAIVFFHREFSPIFVRNFLFVGIPYFCIGCWIKNGWGKQIKYNVLKLCIPVFTILSFLERFILETIEMNATRDHYITTTFIAVAVFLYTLKIKPSGLKRLAIIGKNYSTQLYVLHPIFIAVLSKAAHIAGIYEVYKYIAPVAVCIATLSFSIILDKILTRKK